MSQSFTQTAAQRVLTSPELIGEILSCVKDDYHESWSSNAQEAYPIAPTRRSTLARCAQINSIWFPEAMRQLWNESSSPPSYSLPQTLTGLTRSMKQYYVRFITNASLIEVQKSTIRINTEAVQGVSFQELRTLHLILDRTRPKVWLPKTQTPRLETVHIRFATITKTTKPNKFHLRFRNHYPWSQTWKQGQSIQTRKLKRRWLYLRLAKTLARQIQVRSFDAPIPIQ